MTSRRVADVDTLLSQTVTRCRYSKVVRIRALMGCSDPLVAPPTQPGSTVDPDDFITIDITTSWLGGDVPRRGNADILNGAVLAFFHATEGAPVMLAPVRSALIIFKTIAHHSSNTDRDGQQDNDRVHLGDWTNWCVSFGCQTPDCFSTWIFYRPLTPACRPLSQVRPKGARWSVPRSASCGPT